jgi:hypothetical protein
MVVSIKLTMPDKRQQAVGRRKASVHIVGRIIRVNVLSLVFEVRLTHLSQGPRRRRNHPLASLILIRMHINASEDANLSAIASKIAD